MRRKSIRDLVVVVGWCYSCEQDISPLTEYDGLPKHLDKNGHECKNSGYSAQYVHYQIETDEHALQLAQTILDDDTKCLNGMNWHSLACGDGDFCAVERKKRARALAEYLTKILTK